MLNYPCLPYEIFIRYAILVGNGNDGANKFLQEQQFPTIEDAYLDARRDELCAAAPHKGIKNLIRGEFKPPKNGKGFRKLLEWLVSTKIIFPFMYYNPKFMKFQTNIEFKLIQEVFMLVYHPVLRRIHNCHIFFKGDPEFNKWFPARTSFAALEWYKFIFFNLEKMESEGDWTYYYSKIEPSEARLYDSARKNEIKFCIWLLGGIPTVTIDDLQSNIQAVAYWKIIERMRQDFMGLTSDDKKVLADLGKEDPKAWAKVATESVRANANKALPPPTNPETSELFKEYGNQSADAVLEIEDPQAAIPEFTGPREEKEKRKPVEEEDFN